MLGGLGGRNATGANEEGVEPRFAWGALCADF
ncbi:DUF3046 domain-containing protein, partial [Mycobacterium tuberculosis]